MFLHSLGSQIAICIDFYSEYQCVRSLWVICERMSLNAITKGWKESSLLVFLQLFQQICLAATTYVSVSLLICLRW